MLLLTTPPLPSPPPLSTLGSDDDLEYYVRECGQILGVNKKLPEECRSAKHVLEHILTQVAEFKKFNQASSAACTTHSHSHLTCVRCLMTHTPHPSPTHTPRSPFTFPPTLLTHPSPSHPHLTHPSPSYPHFTHPSPSHPHSLLTLHPPTHSSLTLHTPHSPFTLPPTHPSTSHPHS